MNKTFPAALPALHWSAGLILHASVNRADFKTYGNRGGFRPWEAYRGVLKPLLIIAGRIDHPPPKTKQVERTANPPYRMCLGLVMLRLPMSGFG